MCAPIAITVYNRLEHLQRCVNSLKANEDAKHTILFIASDAPYDDRDKDSICLIRKYIMSISGFKEVVPLFWDTNLGGHVSTERLINYILTKYDSFIFLEDDIVVASSFLHYMNAGLLYYKSQKEIFAVCAFSPPFTLPLKYKYDVYFYPCNSPWGFATWKDRWVNVDRSYFDRYSELKKDKRKYKEFISVGFYIKGILQADSKKEIVAGDLRIYYHMFQHHMCSVFPAVSKTQNWGFDGTGEHCGNKSAWWAKPELDTRNQPTKFIPFTGYDEELLKNHRKFQDKINGGIIAKYLKYTWVHRLWKRIKKLL